MASYIANSCSTDVGNEAKINSFLNNSNGKFNVAHMNICSMNPKKNAHKLDFIKSIKRINNFGVFGITESWLKNYISNKSIAIKGFNIIRNDRKKKRGGGVMMYVRTGIKYKVIAMSNRSDIEYLFVEMNINNNKVLIGIVYRPRGRLEEIDKELEMICSNYSSIILMGDFNLDLQVEHKYNQMKNYFESYGLNLAFNPNKPTHFDSHYNSLSILDCFVSNTTNSISAQNQFFLPQISHHALLLASFDIKMPPIVTQFSYRDFNSIDVNDLNTQCENAGFDVIFDIENVDEQTEIIMSNVNNLFDKIVPMKTAQFNNSKPPWFTQDIKLNMTIRDIAFKEYLKDRTNAKWTIYSKLRNKTNLLIRKSKLIFSEKYFDAKQPNSKLWKKIKCAGVIDDQSHNSDNISFNRDEFCDYFASIQSHMPVERFDNNMPEHENPFNFHDVTPDEVIKSILSISSNASGNDNMDVRFLKIVIHNIKSHIAFLFNNIIKSGLWPESWKTSLVCPIPKMSNCTNLNDYRPIGLLPALSKMLEIIMKVQMCDFIDKNSLDVDIQSGFRKNCSTTTALIKVTDDIRKELDINKAVFIINLDFSKAFDNVDHNLLCGKLKLKYKFSSHACNLMHSYLSDRKMTVRLNGELSKRLNIYCGVVQGSVLGSELFKIHISDLPDCIEHMKVHLFADDVRLYVETTLDE